MTLKENTKTEKRLRPQIAIGIKGIFSICFFVDFSSNDFSIINLGTHLCERDWAFFIRIMGFGFRLEIYR